MKKNNKYQFFHPIWMSFYSKALYREVFFNWRGMCFWYLCFISLIYSIGPTVAANRAAEKLTSTIAPPILNQMPVTSIKNGQLTTEDGKMHIIKAPHDENNVLAIIDPHGEASEAQKKAAYIILNSNGLSIKKEGGEIEHYSLDMIGDLTIRPKQLNKWMLKLASFMGLSVYPLAFVWWFSYIFSTATLYAVIVFIAGKTKDIAITYWASTRIAAIAMTPMIMIKLAGWLTGLYTVNMLISFVVTSGFILYGIFAIKANEL